MGRLLRCFRAFALLAAGLPLSAPPVHADDISLTVTAANGSQERIPASLSKPEGSGPFPAVVILHDCSGTGPFSSGAPARWAELLRQRGYVVLMPDSFFSRGFTRGVCTDAATRRLEVSPQRRVRDAYAALAFLRSLDYVDARRVGVMGGSHGGSSTLALLGIPSTSPLLPDDRGFAAAVALYPGCGQAPRRSAVFRPLAPLLILVGEKDDWTPAVPCERLATAAQAEGYPVSIKVYPGAHHSFDSASPVAYIANRVNGNAPGGRGATTGGDPQAWADAIVAVEVFFGRYLAPLGR